MADNVQIEQTNITVETNPAETVVEFRYYGVNEAALAALTPRVWALEDFQDQLAADLNAALAAGTGPLAIQLDALEALVNADIAALAVEQAARIAADIVLGNDIQALDDYLTPLVLAEPGARNAAIAVETAARIAAISAATGPIIADFVALEATVAGYTASIAAINAAQVALALDVTALDADFVALSGEFATWSADFTAVENAVTAEIAARANADADIIAMISNNSSRSFIIHEEGDEGLPGPPGPKGETGPAGAPGGGGSGSGSTFIIFNDDDSETPMMMPPSTTVGSGGGAVATDVIWDAKGDLAAGTGANTAIKLAVGTDNTMLIADSTAPTGLRWGSPTSSVNTPVLLHFDGTNGSTTITNSGGATAFTVSGNAALSTTQNKFGGSSIYFDGTGDYISATYSTALRWYDEDYTIECFVYPVTLVGMQISASQPGLCGNGSIGGGTNYWSFGPVDDGRLAFYYWTGGPNTLYSTATITAGAWHHIALTKTAAGIRLWVNGVGTTVVAVSGSPQDSAGFPFLIGQTAGGDVNAYVDDFRIVKGRAMYEATFTPPVVELDVPTGGFFPTTTLGDLIVRGVTDDERLAIGTSGQVLAVANGTPKWTTPNNTVIVYNNDDSDTPMMIPGSAGSGGGVIQIAVPATPAAGTAILYAGITQANLVPTMTSDTAPSGTASASETFSGQEAWKAFSGGGAEYGWLNNGTALPHWLRYQFPTAKIVKSYKITPWSIDNFPNRTPITWILQGSSDGSTWADLDSRSVSSGSWVINTPTSFTIASPVSYAYYRLYITANGGNTYTGVKRLDLVGDGPVDLFMKDDAGNIRQVTTTAV